MWAKVYERPFVCADVYERTFITVQHLVAAQKCTKMWAKVYERPFLNVAEIYERPFVNVGRGLRTPFRKCAPTFTNITMQHLVAVQKCTKMWAEVYERPFVNVTEIYKRLFVNVGRGLRMPVRKCAPTFTNVTMQQLVAVQKCTKMWAEVYERPFVNVAEIYERPFVNMGRGLRMSVRNCAPMFTNVTMQHLARGVHCTKLVQIHVSAQEGY
jgi:TolB-like protein